MKNDFLLLLYRLSKRKFIFDGRYKLCSKKSALLRRILQWTVLFYTLFFLYLMYFYIESDTTTVCLLVSQRQIA